MKEKLSKKIRGGSAMRQLLLGGLVFIWVITPPIAFAQVDSLPQELTLQGRILDTLNPSMPLPIEDANVDFLVRVLSDSNCELYQEIINKDMTGSAGIFSLSVGSADPDQLREILLNQPSVHFTGVCSGGTDYIPGANDRRKVLISFRVNGGAWQNLDGLTQTIQSVPYAVHAATLQGAVPEDFVQLPTGVDAATTGPRVDRILGDEVDGSGKLGYENLRLLLEGAPYATAPSGGVFDPGGSIDMNNEPIVGLPAPLAGDQAVNKDYADGYIGGAPVSSEPGEFDLADPANNGKAIIWNQADGRWELYDTSTGLLRLDGSRPMAGNLDLDGNDIVNVNDITANQMFVGRVNASEVNVADTYTLKLGAVTDAEEATLVATPLGAADRGRSWYNSDSNEIKYWDGSAVVVLGVAGAGMQSLGGLSANDQSLAIGTAGTAPAWNSVTDTHTLNIPMASVAGVTAGLLSKADYDTFMAKQDALGFTPVDSALASAQIYVGDGGGVAQARSVSGDVSLANDGQMTVVGIQGQAVAAGAAVEGQVYRMDGASTFQPVYLSFADLKTAAGAQQMPGVSCTAGQSLSWSSVTDTFTCESIQISTSQVTDFDAEVNTLADARIAVGTALNFSGSLAGDVTGTQGATTVEGLQGRSVHDAAPVDGQVLVWSDADTRWEPQALPAAPVSSVAGKTGAVTLDSGDITDFAAAVDARLGSMATETATDYLRKDENLSGLANVGTARTNLGITATGDSLVTAADAPSARSALGITATGDAVATAADAAAARSAIGAVNIAGDTMTGPLVLSGDPAAALEAATKQYVDAELTAGLATKEDSLGFTPVNKAGDTGIGSLALAAQANLRLGAYTNAEETTFIGGLGAGDSGRSWYNSDTNQIKYWDGGAVVILGVAGSGLQSLGGLSANDQVFAVGTAGTAPAFNSVTDTHTLNIPMASAAGVTAGLLSKADYDTFMAKQDALGFTPVDSALASAQIYVGDGGGVAQARSVSGDVSLANDGEMTVVGIQGQAVAAGAAVEGQVYRMDGTSTFQSVFLNVTDLRSSVTPATAQFPTGCTAGQTMLWSAPSDIFECTNIAITSAQMTDFAAAVDARLGSMATETATDYLRKDENLSGLANTATARSNLGITATGDSLVTAADAPAARSAIGAVNIAGDTMTGPLVLSADPAAALQAATKQYVDAELTAGLATKEDSLGFTPVNKAGDTGIGSLALAAQANLRLGAYTNAEETTFIGGLGAGDSGRSWYNSDTNQIKYWNGSAVVVLGVAGSGLQSLGGLSDNDQILAIGTAGTAPAWNSVTDTHTLNIPMASGAGVTAGLLSRADYDTFMAKQNALGFTPVDSALASAQIYVGDAGGVAQARSISGDATLSNTGALTIGAGAINEGKLADSAVATAKIADGAVTDAKIDSVSGAKVTGNITGNAAGFTGSLTGDVTGTQGATSVERIRGRSVHDAAPTDGQALVWNNAQSRWEPQALPSAPVTSVAGRTGAVTLTTADIGGLGTMATETATDYMRKDENLSGLANTATARTNLGITATGNSLVTAADAAAARSAIGAVNIGGDTMTGPLVLSGDPAAALQAATKQYVDAELTAGLATKEDSLGFTPINKAGDTGIGSLSMATQANLQLGSYTNAQEGTFVTGLGAGDAGRSWYNSDTNQIKYWNGSAVSVLGVAGAGLQSLGGLSANDQVFAIGTAGTAPAFNSVTDTHTLNIPMASAAGVTAGLLSKADYDSFAGKLDAVAGSSLNDSQIFVGNASNQAAAVSVSGDATLSNAGALTVTGIRGRTVASSAVAEGQIYRMDGANTFQPVYMNFADLRTAGGVQQLPGSSCTAGQTLTWSSVTDSFSCTNIAIGTAQITNFASEVNTLADARIAVGTAAGFSGSLTGDVTGTQGATSVERIRGRSVHDAAPTDGQALVWNNAQSRWEPQALPSAPVTSVAGRTGAVTLTTADISGLGTIATETATDYMRKDENLSGLANTATARTNLGITATGNSLVTAADAAAARSAIGAVNIAGDTMTGPLVLSGDPAAALQAATKQYVDAELTAGLATKEDSLGFTPINKAGDTGIGSLSMATQANLQLGSYTNAQEGTFVAGLGAGDAGRSWYNSNTNQIKYWNGSAVSVLGVAGAGLQSLGGLSANDQVFAVGTAGTAPAWNSSVSTHTFNIPMASAAGVTAGLLSKTDYDAFVAKLSAVPGSPLTSGQIFVGNASNQAAAVAMSGDATLSNAGVLTVGASAITESKIANDAVTTAKIADGAVTDAKIDTVSGAKVSGNITGNAAGFTGALAGDVTGAQGTTTVERIRGRAVHDAIPTEGQVLVWNNTLSRWEPRTLPSAPVTSVAGKTGVVTLQATDITDFSTAADARITAARGVANGVASLDGASQVPIAQIPDIPVNKVANGAGLYFDYRPNNTACTAGQLLVWNNTQNRWECGTAPSGADDLGNHTATQNLNLGTHSLVGNGGSAGITITNGGNVGVGMAATEKLDVSGNIRASGSVQASGGQVVAGQGTAAGAIVDFNTGNVQIVSAPGGSALTLNNMVDGGAYTVIVTDTVSRTYTFTGCTNSHFIPANGPTEAGKQTVYTILKVTIAAQTHCYISWIAGF